MPKALARTIDDRSARGIAAGVSRLITSGGLRPGERLPTVRALARELGVSPTTVSEAWQSLGEVGAIQARGRLGTFVIGPATLAAPRRYRSVTEGAGAFGLDLSTGTPDPELLPDLSASLAHVSRRALTTTYLDDPVLPELAEVLRDGWPFQPEALTVVDGAMDALDRLITLTARLGDRVMVERATFPPVLDLLEQLGVEVIGLDTDADGIIPNSLAEAMNREPVALITQPRAHNPTSTSTSAERAAELAAVLRGTPVLVIEDDHAGDIATSELHTIGAHLPGQTVLVRSYSKSHGPDLRLAAVGGAGAPIERMARRRMLGPGWSSRLLQAVLAELLGDRATLDRLDEATAMYAARRSSLVAALADRGIVATGTDGINVWVAVPDERAAQVSLAARGIGVAPGTPFLVGADPDGDHLRVTISMARDIERLADDLAAAATPGGTARRLS